MKTTVVIIIGDSGAGKSTLTDALYRIYGIPVISYNQIMSEIAASRGFNRDRTLV